MTRCPACMGEGGHDMRDTDAILEEFLSDEDLALAKRTSRGPWGGVVECDVCEGTGLVTEEVAADMAAAARATVDQVMAKIRDEEGRG